MRPKMSPRMSAAVVNRMRAAEVADDAAEALAKAEAELRQVTEQECLEELQSLGLLDGEFRYTMGHRHQIAKVCRKHGVDLPPTVDTKPKR